MSIKPPQALPRWVQAGRLLRSHGVDGTMRASLDGAVLPALQAALVAAPGAAAPQVRLLAHDGRQLLCTLTAYRPIHGAVLLRCREISCCEAVRFWHGATIEVPANWVPPLAVGEAYLYELLGACVVDVQANVVGTVEAIIDNAGQTLLRLRHDSDQGGPSERFLPLVEQTLHHIDRANHKVVVRIPEGLWEAV